MKATLVSLFTLLFLYSSLGNAQSVALDSALPDLVIDDRGELQYDDDSFSFTPWIAGAEQPGKVHVLQYFGGTLKDSKRFEPLTNLLRETFTPGSYHVTTIINLDAAMWGTAGFVVSQLKENKLKYPTATMVIDEEGSGVEQWQLGDAGAVLVIMNTEGQVLYVEQDALSTQQLTEAVELVRTQLGA